MNSIGIGIASTLLIAVIDPVSDCTDSDVVSDSACAAFKPVAEDIKDAIPGLDMHSNEPVIYLHLSEVGRAKFSALQDNCINQKIDLFVGEELVSSPRLYERILGNEIQLSGGFTIKQTETLAFRLRNLDRPNWKHSD